MRVNMTCTVRKASYGIEKTRKKQIDLPDNAEKEEINNIYNEWIDSIIDFFGEKWYVANCHWEKTEENMFKNFISAQEARNAANEENLVKYQKEIEIIFNRIKDASIYGKDYIECEDETSNFSALELYKAVACTKWFFEKNGYTVQKGKILTNVIPETGPFAHGTIEVTKPCYTISW